MSKNNEVKREMENLVDAIMNELETENKENKKENKENKKENKEMKNNNIENNERKTKNDLNWLTGGTANNKSYNKESKEKVTNKIVKINSNIFNVTLITLNNKIKYTLTHKQTKKGNVKVTIESEQFENMTLKFKEDKNEAEGINIKDVKIIKEDSKEDYTKEYIIVDDMAIPLEVLINPLFDFYITNKKLRRQLVMYTEGTIKIKDDKITMDARLRKGEYPVSGNSMSLEDLQELDNENDDNEMGIALEMMRRFAISEGDLVGEIKPEEDKSDLSAPDQIIAIIEDNDVKQKEQIMTAIDENKSYDTLVKIMNNMDTVEKIIEILKNKEAQKQIKAVLKINDEQLESLIDYKEIVKLRNIIDSEKMNEICETKDNPIFDQIDKAIKEIQRHLSNDKILSMKQAISDTLGQKLTKVYYRFRADQISTLIINDIETICK